LFSDRSIDGGLSIRSLPIHPEYNLFDAPGILNRRANEYSSTRRSRVVRYRLYYFHYGAALFEPEKVEVKAAEIENRPDQQYG
jgi:hypothetical protein